jgi:thioredoxin 1
MEDTAQTPQAHAYVEATDANYEQEVLQFPGVVLVDYWADWCHPCHAMAPHVEALAAEYAGRDDVKIVKIDVDTNEATAMQERVMSLPTFKIFKNGAVVDEMIGAGGSEALKAFLVRNLPAA